LGDQLLSVFLIYILFNDLFTIIVQINLVVVVVVVVVIVATDAVMVHKNHHFLSGTVLRQQFMNFQYPSSISTQNLSFSPASYKVRFSANNSATLKIS